MRKRRRQVGTIGSVVICVFLAAPLAIGAEAPAPRPRPISSVDVTQTAAASAAARLPRPRPNLPLAATQPTPAVAPKNPTEPESGADAATAIELLARTPRP